MTHTPPLPFKIYRSSAGSGKTYTLTKEYLKLLLVCPALPDFHESYYRHVLAITFTNDATNEMKERILLDLERYAKGEVDGKLQMIVQEARAEYPDRCPQPEAQLCGIFCQRAKRILHYLLHHYADFSVSTIDAFNQRLVQAFKKDLALPFNYELLLDSDTLIQKSVDALLDRLGREAADSLLTEVMVEFVEQQVEDGRNWNIGYQLQQFGSNLFEERHQPIIDKLATMSLEDFRPLPARMREYLKQFEDIVMQAAQAVVDLFAQHDLQTEDFVRGTQGPLPYFKRLAGGADIFQAPNSYVRPMLEEGAEWIHKKSMREKGGAFESIRPQVMEQWERIQRVQQNEGLKEFYLLSGKLLRNIYSLGMLHELQQQLAEIKKQENSVHISEVNRRIHEVVAHDPVPFIYERLGDRYHHILIDEFQDTSELQWHNLIPLVANGLGNALMSLVVGDTKQAIYRWRGGNADMLADLPEVPTLKGTMLAEDTRHFPHLHQVLNLDTNRRSRDQVVDFNNRLFAHITAMLQQEHKLQKHYADYAQKPNGKEGGQVEVFAIEYEKGQGAAYERATLAALQQQIRLLQQQGYALGDIAILVNRNRDGVLIASHLLEQGIEVVSSESLLVRNADCAGILTDFMELMLRPDDGQVRANLLRRLLRRETSGKDFPLSRYREVLQACTPAADATLSMLCQALRTQFGLQLDADKLPFLDLYELTESLIRGFRLQERAQEQIFLQRFMDEVLTYRQKADNSLFNFLQYWKQKSDGVSISLPPSDRAVQIMTIHKSKGLQFPVVLLPFADWSTTPSHLKDKLWVEWKHPALAPLEVAYLPISSYLADTSLKPLYEQECTAVLTDALNKLYVAVTRPEERLLIFCKKEPTNKSINQVNKYLLHMASSQQEIEHNEGLHLTVTDTLGWEHTYFYDHYAFFDHEDGIPMPKGAATQAEHLQLQASEPFLHTEYRDRIRLRGNGEQKRVRLRDLAEHPQEDGSQYGTLMHMAFEQVLTAADIPAAVERLFRQGYLQAHRTEALRKRMEQVVALPQLAALFSDSHGYQVRNEAEVYTPQKDVRRIDRLMRKPGEIIILDYKSGEPEEEHLQQVREYKALFEGENVRALLVYVHQLQVVEV